VRLPQRVGDYTLLSQLGSGSFGTVYRARIEGDLGFSQEVAVKLVDSRQSRDRPDVITALVDEAQFLARLAHPHIVAVRRFARVEHEFLGEVHLMEMELVKGVPLSRVLASVAVEGTKLPVDAVLTMLLETVDALVYAHDLRDSTGRPAGLIHRDLKPDNLLVSKDGRLKVLDFGIAWAEERSASTTGTGLTKGTPMYMSPEQARGEPADPRGDLYALGTIAFECLTGEKYVALPEGARVDLPAVIMAVATTTWAERVPTLMESLTAPSPRGRGMDPDQAKPIARLLGRLLASKITDRVPSASAFAHELDELASAWKPHLGRRYLRAAVTDLMPQPIDPNAATEVAAAAETATNKAAKAFDEVVDGGAAEPTRLSPPQPATLPHNPRKNLPMVFGAMAVALIALVLAFGPWRNAPRLDPEPVVDETPAVPPGSGSDEPALANGLVPEATPDTGEATDEEPTDEEPTDEEPTDEQTPATSTPAVEPSPSASPTPAPPPERSTPAVATSDSPAPAWPVLRPKKAKPYIIPKSLVLSVTVSGGDVQCAPEARIRARTRPRGRWLTVPMRPGEGGTWSATMKPEYNEGWDLGAEYWFRCCTDEGVCGAQHGGPDAPLRVDAAAL